MKRSFRRTAFLLEPTIYLAKRCLCQGGGNSTMRRILRSRNRHRRIEKPGRRLMYLDIGSCKVGGEYALIRESEHRDFSHSCLLAESCLQHAVDILVFLSVYFESNPLNSYRDNLRLLSLDRGFIAYHVSIPNIRAMSDR